MIPAGAGGALLLALTLGAVPLCRAGTPRFCDQQANVTPAQQGRVFRVAALVKAELERSGHRMALMSRAGLNLDRFGVRYSHAGFSLKASANGPWSVRQLYYACDEGQPRLFDQGVSGFLLGMDSPDNGFLSVVFLPEDAEAELEPAVLDSRRALRVLGPDYSANAYAYSTRYQNCNQWVAELLAAVRGHTLDADRPRERAQDWLREQGYQPSAVDVGLRPLMWLSAFIPWLHQDDHPEDDLAANRFRVSMPAAIEAFVHTTMPTATRLEICHTDRQVVIRHGWTPIAEGCVAGEGDTVVALD